MLARNLHWGLLLLIAASTSCSTSRSAPSAPIEENRVFYYVHREDEQRTSRQAWGRIVNETENDILLHISMGTMPYWKDEVLFLIPGEEWRMGFHDILGNIACLSPSEEIIVSDLADQYGLWPNKISSVLGLIEEYPGGTACPSNTKLPLIDPLSSPICVEWQADDTATFRIVKKWDCYWPPLEPEGEAIEVETEGS